MTTEKDAMATYFPVGLNLAGRWCLVVGGGPVAARRVRSLHEAGARIVVVAAEVAARLEHELRALAEEVRLRPFVAEDLDGMFVVVAATDDRGVNREVAQLARSRGILVTCVDDPANCDFVLPAVIRRGAVQVSVSTGGASPALARHLRRLLDRLLPAEYAQLAEALAAVRARLRRAGVRPDPEAG